MILWLQLHLGFISRAIIYIMSQKCFLKDDNLSKKGNACKVVFLNETAHEHDLFIPIHVAIVICSKKMFSCGYL